MKKILILSGLLFGLFICLNTNVFACGGKDSEDSMGIPDSTDNPTSSYSQHIILACGGKDSDDDKGLPDSDGTSTSGYSKNLLVS